MKTDPLEQLRAENPLPELLPGLPFELVRQLKESEPPLASSRSRPRKRFAPVAFPFGMACLVGVALLLAFDALPSSNTDGLQVANAVAAVQQGQQDLSNGSGSFRYTAFVQTISAPQQGTSRSSERFWIPEHGTLTSSWRAFSSNTLATDLASVGGIVEYYIPSRHTIYLDRPGRPRSISAVNFDSDTVAESAIAALLNVESRRAAGGSAPQVARALMKLPGAQVSRANGLTTITVHRGTNVSTIVVRSGSFDPVMIRRAEPGPLGGDRPDYVTTLRVLAYNQPTAAPVVAKQLNLMLAYPHARVVTIHKQNLNVPAYRLPPDYSKSVTAIIGELGSFSRPQQPSDLEGYHSGKRDGRFIIRGLVRLARTEPIPGVGTVRLYLVLGRLDGVGWSRPFGGAGWASAEAIGPGGTIAESPRYLPDRYQPEAVSVQPLSPNGPRLALSVVDSGVTRVTWTFSGIAGAPPTTVQAHVINNIAYAPVPAATGGLTHASWAGPNWDPPRHSGIKRPRARP